MKQNKSTNTEQNSDWVDILAIRPVPTVKLQIYLINSWEIV